VQTNPSQNRRHEYYLKNKDKIREQQKSYREANREKCNALSEKWRLENKERINFIRRKENTKNPLERQAIKNAYKRRLKNQMPPWANKEKIKSFYLAAQEQQLTVDHIIPLKGDLVSGLHVETNLQLLPKVENCRKSNSF